MAAAKSVKPKAKRNPSKPGIRSAIRDGARVPGRPRTTIEDLPEDWEAIMKAEAQEGNGATGIMVKLGIHNHALNTLLEDSEQFRIAFEECMLLCKYWWESQGRKMASGADGSAPVWALNMTNRFNWRSGRNEVVGDKTAPLEVNAKVTELPATKAELLAELEKRGLPTKLFEG